jgi:Protein of unknown function (DUF2695)
VTGKASTDRKKLLTKAFKEAERKAELASSPLSPRELRALLDMVSAAVLGEDRRNMCDHTHRQTRRALAALGMGDDDRVVSFLSGKGFHCDCEVALNLGSWLAWNAPEGGAGI